MEEFDWPEPTDLRRQKFSNSLTALLLYSLKENRENAGGKEGSAYPVLFRWIFSLYSNQSHSISLYVKGRILGFKRGKRSQSENQSLLQIEGVKSKEGRNIQSEFMIWLEIDYWWTCRYGILSRKTSCICLSRTPRSWRIKDSSHLGKSYPKPRKLWSCQSQIP